MITTLLAISWAIMENIDFNFIGEEEGGQKRVGYIIKGEAGKKSGVTIATGFDIGQRNLNDLSGLPRELVEKLAPFVKGTEVSEERAKSLKISKQEADIIDNFSKQSIYNNLAEQWKSSTGTNFSELPKQAATVLMSVAFQYGSNLRIPAEQGGTPEFWKLMTSRNWSGAVKELNNFGDKTPGRRKKEASLLQTLLEQEQPLQQQPLIPKLTKSGTVTFQENPDYIRYATKRAQNLTEEGKEVFVSEGMERTVIGEPVDDSGPVPTSRPVPTEEPTPRPQGVTQ